ncbi:hypothetical protein SDC9_174862 [bioreactor metagenome]|uniref:Uncharacterized protein n=1 Tax=bioreactor metagenome TaxID=1076179 RepID=A0A645GNE8_9ZZZZ
MPELIFTVDVPQSPDVWLDGFQIGIGGNPAVFVHGHTGLIQRKRVPVGAHAGGHQNFFTRHNGVRAGQAVLDGQLFLPP